MGAGDVIVGIDLGTTNSLVAVCDEKGPRVLEGAGGGAIVPSVVRYERDDGAPGGVRTLVGVEAKERAVEFPERTVVSVKRLMGRSVEDARADVPYLSYRVVEDEHAQARVEVRLGEDALKVVSPQEVSAVILRDLKARAEEALGHEVHKAVVTVPAYFDDAQRQATRDAGRLAGLEVVRIVNEPTAAALAYGLGLTGHTKPRTIVVYDLGGGTFDVSVLRLTPGEGEGGTSFFQVLSTAGDTRLGGDDVDHMLVSLFVREIRG
ncbi:MAG: Hsp70 family protein [Phycisphaerales bacterium]